MRFAKVCGAFVAMLMASVMVCWAAVSDSWQALASPSGRRQVAWRVANSSGDLLPGAASTFSLGSATVPAKFVYTRNLNMGHTSYSANTTLTASSPGIVGCTNATALITLANATTAGSGARQIIVNEAATGNVTATSASNISGGANATILQLTAGEFVSDGTHWFRLY